MFSHYMYYLGWKRLERQSNDSRKVSLSLAVLLWLAYRETIKLFHTQKLAATFCDSWRKSIYNLGNHHKKTCQSSSNASSFPVQNSGFVKIIWFRCSLKWSIVFSSQTPYNTILRHTMEVENVDLFWPAFGHFQTNVMGSAGWAVLPMGSAG